MGETKLLRLNAIGTGSIQTGKQHKAGSSSPEATWYDMLYNPKTGWTHPNGPLTLDCLPSMV